jgi:hypothetical protein
MQAFSISFMQWIDPYAWFIVSLLTFILGIIGFSPLNYDHNLEKQIKPHEITLCFLRRCFFLGIPLLGFLLPLLAWFFYVAEQGLNNLNTYHAFWLWYKSKLLYWLYPVGWLIVAWIVRFYLVRHLRPAFSNFQRKLRINQKTDTLSDIREEKERYNTRDFIPEQFYQSGKLLIGMNILDKPEYINWDDWLETNMQILGPTRSGKGVVLGNLLAQAILFGNTVFFIDPKGDKFIPHIMADFAKKAGRNFYYYDLNDPTANDPRPGEWAPFTGGDLRSRRARILTAFGLQDTGGESDFYKGRERKLLDELLNKTGGRLSLLLAEFENNPHYQEIGQRLYNGISQWVQVKSLCPKKGRGLSVEKSLLNNAIVYIRGSLDDDVVKEATRMLVMEIVQEIKRLHPARKSHVTLAIDEVRFLVSNPLVDSLATIAGYNANVVIAYQAKNDVRNLTDRNLEPESIAQSINTNCQLKLIYGSLDPETNKWAAEMSGERLKLVTRTEHTKIGELGEEIWERTRTVGQEREELITENTMLSLEKCVGVLFQPRDLAKVIFTAFVPTELNNDLSKTDVV